MEKNIYSTKNIMMTSLFLTSSMMWQPVVAADYHQVYKPKASIQQTNNSVEIDGHDYMTTDMETDIGIPEYLGKIEPKKWFVTFYAGYTEHDAPMQDMTNKIKITNEKKVNFDVVAAHNGNGDANNNVIELFGDPEGTVLNHGAMAGIARTGNASNNKITMSNMVEIHQNNPNEVRPYEGVGSDKDYRISQILAGSGSVDNISGNAVDITGHPGKGLDIYGFVDIRSAINSSGTATNNTLSLANVKNINISNSPTRSTSIVAAYGVKGASENTLNIAAMYGKRLEIHAAHITAGASSNDSENNKNIITLTDLGLIAKDADIYGAEVEKNATASKNKVIIKGTSGTIKLAGLVVGAKGLTDSEVKNNEVILGSSYTGSAIDIIHAKDSGNGLFGGQSKNIAEGNIVKIADTNKARIDFKDNALVVGGFGKVANENIVNLSSNEGSLRDKAKIYGGKTNTGGETASNNQVQITGNFVLDGESTIYGGAGNGKILSNSVVLDGVNNYNENVQIIGGSGDNNSFKPGTTDNNKVHVTNITADGTFESALVGGEAVSFYTDAKGNAVTIDNIAEDTILNFKAYGARINAGTGTLEDNIVNIVTDGKRATIGDKARIYGAGSPEDDYSGYMKKNSVSIHNFTNIAEGSEIYGAQGLSAVNSAEPDAVNNKVIIGSDGQTIDVRGDIYGAKMEKQANRNQVTLNNMGTIGKNAEIYGGYGEEGAVENNAVEINGNHKLSLQGKVIAGYSEGELSIDSNKVLLTKVEGISGDVFAAYGESESSASQNTIEITGIKAGASIRGLISGAATGNEVRNNEVTLNKINAISEDAVIYGGGQDYDAKIASGNKVIINMDGADRKIEGEVNGGKALNESNANSVVIMNASIIDENVYGGDAKKGVSDQNKVSIVGESKYGLALISEVFAGRGKKGANANELVIRDLASADSDIYAGHSRKGTANNNSLTIKGIEGEHLSAVNGIIYAGYGRTEASENKIYLEGVKANNSIIGGRAIKGKAQNNNIYIYGDNDLENAYIMGGTSNGNFLAEDSGDNYRLGNVLHIGVNSSNRQAFESYNPKGNVVRGVQNFEKIKFYEVIGKANYPALKILEKSDLSETKIDASNISFKDMAELNKFLKTENAKVILIDTNGNNDGIKEGNIETGVYTIGTTTESHEGVALLEGNNVVYHIGSVQAIGGEGGGAEGAGGEAPDEGGESSGSDSGGSSSSSEGDSGGSSSGKPGGGSLLSLTAQEQTHNVVIGQTSAFAAVSGGQSFVDQALTNSVNSFGLITAFGASAGSDKYETGSHIKTKIFNANLALGYSMPVYSGKLAYIGFFEYGHGSYDTESRGVKGDGDIDYKGIAIATKYQHNSGFYTEGSLRYGHAKNTANNVLTDVKGNAYSYETSGNYVGGSLGLGQIFNVTDNADLDVYTKYTYMHLDKDDFYTGLTGRDHYKLDAVNSHIGTLGFRMNHNINDWNIYYGLAAEYQFDGKSTGTADGVAIRAADVKGTTAMFELGTKLQFSAQSNWALDFGVKGYIGKHQGVRGNFGLSYKF